MLVAIQQQCAFIDVRSPEHPLEHFTDRKTTLQHMESCEKAKGWHVVSLKARNPPKPSVLHWTCKSKGRTMMPDRGGPCNTLIAARPTTPRHRCSLRSLRQEEAFLGSAAHLNAWRRQQQRHSAPPSCTTASCMHLNAVRLRWGESGEGGGLLAAAGASRPWHPSSKKLRPGYDGSSGHGTHLGACPTTARKRSNQGHAGQTWENATVPPPFGGPFVYSTPGGKWVV